MTRKRGGEQKKKKCVHIVYRRTDKQTDRYIYFNEIEKRKILLS